MRELDYHLGKLRLWPGEIVAGTLETTADGHVPDAIQLLRFSYVNQPRIQAGRAAGSAAKY